MISPEDVRKLAALARIKLLPDEEEKLAKDMESILGYVKQIQEVSASAEISEKETLRNVLRDDTCPHEPGIHTEALLQNAPKRGGLSDEASAKSGQYVKVKKIL